MGIADQERSMEQIETYVYGQTDSDNINVFIINKGSVTINITHVWVMKTDLSKTLVFTSENVSEPLNGVTLPLQLIPSAQETIQDLSLTTMPLNETEGITEYYSVYVTTARGNKFPPKTITHSAGGGWGIGENPPWIEIFVRDANSDADIYQFTITSDSGFYAETTSYKVLNDYYTIVPTWEYGRFTINATNIKENPDVFLGTTTVMLVIENPVGLADFIDEGQP
jgi:hypothetical protein